jgi:hypothetical protein
LHIEAAGEQGAGSKGEDLQVLPNHARDAICRRNSLPVFAEKSYLTRLVNALTIQNSKFKIQTF